MTLSRNLRIPSSLNFAILKGLVMNFWAPITPQQNGVVECYNIIKPCKKLLELCCMQRIFLTNFGLKLWTLLVTFTFVYPFSLEHGSKEWLRDIPRILYLWRKMHTPLKASVELYKGCCETKLGVFQSLWGRKRL